MSADRFNKAARDGYLDALKEATRKDLNHRDEDGMTPTLWASFEGNLDALRLIISRGGDPDKCDNYGNTALHFAAARGHLHCVTFLVNFGVNMWALDVDYHTPKDLAAINNKEEILRFLDAAIAKAEATDKKKVKNYKEKALKDAKKIVKQIDEIQRKAESTAKKQHEKIMKSREKMEKSGGMSSHIITDSQGIPVEIATVSGKTQHHSLVPSLLSLRRDSAKGGQGASGSHSFSELTSSVNSSTKGRSGGLHTGVSKKILQRKTLSSAKATGSDFKVGDVTDGGKRSVRSLSGLRRDNEVMYVPKYEITAGNGGRRGKISGLFENEDGLTTSSSVTRRLSGRGGSEPEDEYDEDENNGGGGLSRSLSQPDYINQAGIHHSSSSSSRFSNQGSVTSSREHTGGVSIFERPGFGSVAFRKNINSTLSNFASFSAQYNSSSSSNNNHSHNNNNNNKNGRMMMDSGVLLEEEDDDSNHHHHHGQTSKQHRDSIGSASSLDGRSKTQSAHRNWPDEGEVGSGDEEELGELDRFLAAAHLMDYAHIFNRQKIDLEGLMRLTEEEFKSMGMETGSRRKLLNAIADRRSAIDNPGEIIDTRM